ncbi:RdgB/HAM1 family non-canonical purine NTP pyrophosphatase [Aestuariimicrobium ganziense]|uniref:RdgB/HAM1 family non-canonical purine NTP pyrophosphatase n=1 Tax=Aestuariimicrobium ganziense TaxID=2773677 RepID=UPI001943DD7A|nr:RdgB/HAM1 family non-canonical purine NTP pyrophosphatase [Aestuariimicrobium ganziense]
MRPLPYFDSRPAVVLATHNAGKLAELKAMLEASDVDVTVLGLDDLPRAPVPDETGDTFEANALIKAHDAASRSGLPALADDSGIEVDALDRMPGIRSARWAGADASDDDNLHLLLSQVDGVPDARRTARFVAAVALVVPGGDERVVRATWEGRLATAPRGTNGFGYDPIFLPDDVPGRTSAELESSDKNSRSHRGQAMDAMLPLLVGTLAGVQGVVPRKEER